MESQWIDVNDKMPDEGNNVLVCKGNIQQIAFVQIEYRFIGDEFKPIMGRWKTSFNSHILDWHPTHWMHLPKPPTT